jgi:hypothetical protein
MPLLLVLLNLWDAVLTVSFPYAGLQEGNPVMRAVLDLGPGPFVVTKVLLASLLAALLLRHRRTLAWACGFFGGVVGWNLLMMLGA